MKFIKFTLTGGKSFVVPFEKAQEIMESKTQVAMIYEGGKWTGESFNKSFVISTTRDFDAEKDWRINQQALLTEESIDPEKTKKIRGEISNMVEKFTTDRQEIPPIPIL